MQGLHDVYPDDAEAAIFYALALNGAVDFNDKDYTKQLKAAAILDEQAKAQPNHPGVAHYLIHNYDFAPLAAMCVPSVLRSRNRLSRFRRRPWRGHPYQRPCDPGVQK
jgi:hypothetical protein